MNVWRRQPVVYNILVLFRLQGIFKRFCLFVITNNQVIKGVHFVEYRVIVIQLDLEEQVCLSYKICI